MAAFLALDRCEVRIDPAGTDLRIGEGQRDVFASRRLRLAHPATSDFGRGLSGEDAVVRLAFRGFLAILLDADGRIKVHHCEGAFKAGLGLADISECVCHWGSPFRSFGLCLREPLVPVDAGP